MQTLYFTKKFTSENLRGLTHTDKLSFVSAEAAMAWVSGVAKHATRNGWKLIDHAFQSYAR